MDNRSIPLQGCDSCQPPIPSPDSDEDGRPVHPRTDGWTVAPLRRYLSSARWQLAQVRRVGCDGFPCHDSHITPPPAADVRPIPNADDAATAHQLPPPCLPPLTAACRAVDHGIGHPVALRQRWHSLSACQCRSTYLTASSQVPILGIRAVMVSCTSSH
jgi:hypothetical protein